MSLVSLSDPLATNSIMSSAEIYIFLSLFFINLRTYALPTTAPGPVYFAHF